MPITDEYKYTAQLFAKARLDPDPVSGFMNGDSWANTQEAVFIVKGAKNVRRVQDMLTGLGLSSSNPVAPRDLDPAGAPKLPLSVLEQLAIDACNRVKAWAESDRSTPFPEEAHMLCDGVLMMAAQRRKGVQ